MVDRVQSPVQREKRRDRPTTVCLSTQPDASLLPSSLPALSPPSFPLPPIIHQGPPTNMIDFSLPSTITDGIFPPFPSSSSSFFLPSKTLAKCGGGGELERRRRRKVRRKKGRIEDGQTVQQTSEPEERKKGMGLVFS